mgnify:FL=1
MFFVLLLPSNSYAEQNTITLVRNGIATSIIIMPNIPDENEKMAVDELKDHLSKISGAEIEVKSASSSQLLARLGEALAKNLYPVLIGNLALSDELKKEIEFIGSDPASFILSADNTSTKIAGLTSEGTLFGVYELLEQIGCRWFMPGELGTVIPKLDTVEVKKQKTVQVPSFNARWHSGNKAPIWQRRMRMGGPFFPGSHNIRPIRRDYFNKHPEYFALVNGKRDPRQVCVSNPEVLEITIAGVKEYFRENPNEPWYGMGPNDGGGFCECENCKVLDGCDWDSFSSQLSMTDRYIWFFNQVLDGINDEFSNKKIAFYSYHAYMRPPVKHKPNPNIIPSFAPITICRVHGMGNNICPERSYYEKVVNQWSQLLPEFYERGYWYNLADPGLPFSLIHRIRNEIPKAKEYGVIGWRNDTHHWGSSTPSLYIAAKLMWDHEADVDALLQDFYEKFFGPASEPMGEYLELMDAALGDNDYHTGCSFDMPYFYPRALRDNARKLLENAVSFAGDSIFGTRVKIYTETFAYLESLILMLENNNNFDFVSAKANLEEMDRLRNILIQYDPPMITPNTSESYLKRFFRQTTEQGYDRVTNNNKLLVGFPVNEWDFLIDPTKIGEDIGLWQKNLVGGNWQKINTSLSWGNQGLRYYKGVAWYRQKFIVPDNFDCSSTYLWFGGIDDGAKIWLNDKVVGEQKGSAFLPFEFEVSNLLIPGEENVIVVRISNEKLDELGMGGIVYPVMIYAKDSNPSNLRQTDDLWEGRDPILY